MRACMFVYRMLVSGSASRQPTGGKSVLHLRIEKFFVWLYVAVSHPGFSPTPNLFLHFSFLGSFWRNGCGWVGVFLQCVIQDLES